MAGGSSTRFLSEAHGRVGRWLRNKWHLDSLIAIGGMAAVYASTHRNGARAAIKLLHSQYTRNEQARRRFLAEGYAANKVGHRNAVLVLDDDTTEDGEVYLVMELLDGESLEGRLERLGVMSPMEVLHVADQLLEVLACAHPKGILHRDIKPANIYLTRDGSVKLLDFGLARVRELSAEALDQSDGIVFGTVSYIAPEQARADNQNLDSRSDMWSIAATMFRALAGETVHPSTGPIIERLLAVARKPARSLASLAPHLPRPVIELVDRALAFDPEDRWPSANVMRVVVQDVMAQLQEEAESDELDIEIQQPAPSRRTNTLPVTTRARTLDLPTVRAGAGPAAAESGVKRPKTDPVGLSHRPRNLPPSEPAPPDGDETELDLDGLYDKAKAAVPTNPGRSRTLLTKEGRAELRRILDARKAGATAPEPEPAPAPAPARGRRVAGPDVSGVGDIEVEFEDSNAEDSNAEDSIIEVTIDHMHGSRSGPIAERISEPSSATPAPVPLEAPVAQSLAAATTMPAAAVLEIDDPGASGSGAATPRSARSESYPAISVEEDTEEEAEAEEEDEAFASPAPPSAASKPTSNLRPPSVPPQQPVPSDSRAASPRSANPQPPANMTRATGRAPQTEITRVGPPPRPASSERPPASPVSSESRPAASNEARPLAPTVTAREITKVGPAPVAPAAPLAAAPPAQESPRPAPRANAGLLHDTMRASTPVTPPAHGSKDEPRKSTNAGLLNETLRPGAAPPPAQARSGPIPAARVEGEPARSTTFSAPVRPGSDAHASTHARATNFVPPAGRASIATPARPAAATPTTPVTASTSPVSPTSPPGASTTLRLPTAAPRPTSQPSASVTATKASEAAETSKATAATSDTAPNKVTTPTKAASDAPAPNRATTEAATDVADAASKAATSVANAAGKAATPAASAATASKAVPAAAAPNKATTPAAGNIATTSAATPTKAASAGAANKAAPPDPTAKPAGTAAQAAPGPASAAQPATRPTGAPAPVVPAASGPVPVVPVVPTVSVPIVPTISVPVVPTVPVPVVPARSTPVASPAPPPERAPEVVATPEPSPRAAARSMFNPYPSLAGGARPEGSATAKTASYATIPAATGKDGAVVSPNPRTSPNARTAPHPVADAAVPKDSTPAPQDSPGPRTGSPTAKTAAYATLSPEDTRGKSGAGPLLPFNFLRGASKPGEAGEPTPPDDPKNPARKKP